MVDLVIIVLINAVILFKDTEHNKMILEFGFVADGDYIFINQFNRREMLIRTMLKCKKPLTDHHGGTHYRNTCQENKSHGARKGRQPTLN